MLLLWTGIIDNHENKKPDLDSNIDIIRNRSIPLDSIRTSTKLAIWFFVYLIFPNNFRPGFRIHCSHVLSDLSI